MKNKKAYNVLEVVITAAILSVLLFVFIWGVIPILTEKQVPFIKGQTEYTTQDCDEDGIIGLNDPCPCDISIKSKQELENAKNCKKLQPNDVATKNCPAFCKV